MNIYHRTGSGYGTLASMTTANWSPPSSGTYALLVAMKLRGVGPVAVRRFAGNLKKECSEEVNVALFQQYGLLRNPDDLDRARDRAREIIDACERKSIFIVSMLDDEYAQRLKQIIDAPPILYVSGDRQALNRLGCAVVGTRHASEYGAKIAFRISTLLSERELSVISGLALGIDTAAHDGALSAHGVTVAIMAHGLDTVAPSSNRKLAERIIGQNGALVSEHEPGVPARPPEFVRRNRIQSGMAVCSIIVESGEQGGTMHQARFTRSQGRPVLAILPENGNGALQGFNHEGGRLLVREYGAVPVRNTDELMVQITSIVGTRDTEERPSQGAFRV
jgi:DNA processing protein